MKRKINHRVLAFIFGVTAMAVILCIYIFYNIGIGFGDAAVETAKAVKQLNEEWKSKGINPIDTIVQEIYDMKKDTVGNK